MPAEFLSPESYKRLGYAVVPICRSEPGGSMQYLGTGFFITNIGVFATAKHVLMDVIDQNGKTVAGVSALHFLPGDIYYHRQIIRFYAHDNADVALGVLAPMSHKQTGQPLLNELVTLTRRRPPVGERVLTFAYPRTTIARDGDGNSVDAHTTEHVGHIVEHLPNGRDRVMLPGPCYRTDMEILHGASGGPVFDADGHVFGINSTGFNGTPDFFISSVESLFAMAISNVALPGIGDRDRVSIEFLARLGQVPIVGPKS